jgi:UDP-glucose 4-epimerase
MRILLTISFGWLGRFLAPMVRNAGHDAIGRDTAPAANTDVVGSVADRALVGRLFSEHRFDGVVHAGALHKSDIVRYPRRALVDINLSGTLNLLEAAVAHKVSRFVFTSTKSLMITQAIRDELSETAMRLDVKASATLRRRDFNALWKLQAAAGDKFVRGLVLNDHDRVTPISENLHGMPISTLWAV